MNVEIIPAILVESIEEFKEKIALCEDFAETVQWDVMDGQFTEQMTFNDAHALEDLDTTLAIEAHLMVEQPEDWLADLAAVGIDRVLAHAEGTQNLPKLIKKMKEHDFQIGLAISPETPLSLIEPVAADLDEVLVMTVNPGAAGQEFMANQLAKVKQLRKKFPKLNIGVDGGVTLETLAEAKEAGANRFAINSAIFQAPDPASAFEMLESVAKE